MNTQKRAGDKGEIVLGADFLQEEQKGVRKAAEYSQSAEGAALTQFGRRTVQLLDAESPSIWCALRQRREVRLASHSHRFPLGPTWSI